MGLSWYEIGSIGFFKSFFSTIAFNLEDKNWGAKYPIIMNELYMGHLEYEYLKNAKTELNGIKNALEAFGPSSVIWDIDDLGQSPPWGSEISEDITNLSNYFVTCNGEDLFELLNEAIDEAINEKTSLEIENL